MAASYMEKERRYRSYNTLEPTESIYNIGQFPLQRTRGTERL